MKSTVRQHSYCGEQELPARKECERRAEAPVTQAQTPLAEEPKVSENSKAKWEGERGGTDSPVYGSALKGSSTTQQLRKTAEPFIHQHC